MATELVYTAVQAPTHSELAKKLTALAKEVGPTLQLQPLLFEQEKGLRDLVVLVSYHKAVEDTVTGYVIMNYDGEYFSTCANNWTYKAHEAILFTRKSDAENIAKTVDWVASKIPGVAGIRKVTVHANS